MVGKKLQGTMAGKKNCRVRWLVNNWGTDQPIAPDGKMAKSDGIAEVRGGGSGGSGSRPAYRLKGQSEKMAKSNGIADV